MDSKLILNMLVCLGISLLTAKKAEARGNDTPKHTHEKQSQQISVDQSGNGMAEAQDSSSDFSDRENHMSNRPPLKTKIMK